MADQADRDVVDIGIDDAIKKLSPSKIEAVIKKALIDNGPVRLKMYAEMCVRCGLCSEGCHTYLSRNRDRLRVVPDCSPSSPAWHSCYCSSAGVVNPADPEITLRNAAVTALRLRLPVLMQGGWGGGERTGKWQALLPRT